MLFYTLVPQFNKKMDKIKEENGTFPRKKKQCYHNGFSRWKRDISVDKDVSPVKLKLQVELFV